MVFVFYIGAKVKARNLQRCVIYVPISQCVWLSDTVSWRSVLKPCLVVVARFILDKLKAFFFKKKKFFLLEEMKLLEKHTGVG